ncbi:MAG: TonB-dependent receptor [Bacteroidota bacterium]
MSSVSAQQKKEQTGQVTGRVTDSQGLELPGVSVSIKGTTQGTITDASGRYRLNAVNSGAMLQFSFIGMEKQEKKVGNNNVINVTLIESASSLNEVVVLGFGTQKKVNVTGSVSTVAGAELLKAPVANITNALVGTVTGVSGLQAGGEPGANATKIFIRGVSTYGNANPLIVIDGIEQPAEQSYTQLNNMDPNEIAGISVLKDAASTAVYGIRGANGVIIVTTKRGKETKPVFGLSLNYGTSKAINIAQQCTSYEWATARNQAILSDNELGNTTANQWLFSPDQLWKFKNNRDYTAAEVAAMTNLTPAQQAQLNDSPALYYGSTDIQKAVFGNYGPQKQVNFNVSGGDKFIKYYVSLGYFNQIGIGPQISYGGTDISSNFERYNFKSNFDVNVNKNTTVSVNLTGQFGTMSGFGGSRFTSANIPNYQGLVMAVIQNNPLNFPGMIDGKIVSYANGSAGSFGNPLGLQNTGAKGFYANFFDNGAGQVMNTLIDNSVRVNHKMDYLTKGLSIHANGVYQNNYSKYYAETIGYPLYTVQRDVNNPNQLDFYGGVQSANSINTSAGASTWSKIYFDAGIDYDRTFGDHKVTALLLGKASQYNMPSDGYNTPSGLMGLVGRLTYNYKERYMLEYDLGFNGTEQFAKDQRFGYFPAYSVGWVPTNETFLKENKWVTFLKIRASYGEVGNDMLGGTGRRYLYLPNTYNINLSNPWNQGYYLGTSNGSVQNPYYKGASEGALGNPLITWETAKKSDVGLDARFLSDRLSLTADYFYESRSNILTTLGVLPVTFGVPSTNMPPANVGRTINEGYEVSLGWKDKMGQVGYSANLGVSYAKNRIIYMSEAPNPYTWMNRTGFPIGQYFGLVSDGFYNTAQELANRPFNTYANNQATLGDIRYKDLNGDGKIDVKDMAPIGYANLPQYHFNATLGLNYKGFDISVLIIGTANGSFYINQNYSKPYILGYGNLFTYQYNERWTAEKFAAGESITYPRLDLNTGTNNYTTSDFWLKSNDFFRVKNIVIAYTLPSGFTKHLQMNSVRLYLNANNIYTFANALSKFGIDPEQTDTNSAWLYPLVETYNVGLNINF